MCVLTVRYKMKKLIKFSRKERNAFYKELKKLSDNLYKSINEKNEKGETILHVQ
jgi:hypothetical protein